jgi:hypothetical protein
VGRVFSGSADGFPNIGQAEFCRVLLSLCFNFFRQLAMFSVIRKYQSETMLKISKNIRFNKFLVQQEFKYFHQKLVEPVDKQTIQL